MLTPDNAHPPARAPMQRLVQALVSIAIGALISGCGGGGGGATDSPPTQPVSILFAAVIGDQQPVDCGNTLKTLGSQETDAQMIDLRFYLSDIRLVSASGAETPITLDDNAYQVTEGNRHAALIDLAQDGTGACEGSAETNAKVSGTVASGSYTRLRATLGLPPEMNHSNLSTRDKPVHPALDLATMFWNWQLGRKFLLLEIKPVIGVGNYPVHLGSTNCAGDTPGDYFCTRANKVSIDIDFDPITQRVGFDLKEVFRNVDVTRNLSGFEGCMSQWDDLDCQSIFANLGLSLTDGSSLGTQRAFRAIPK